MGTSFSGGILSDPITGLRPDVIPTDGHNGIVAIAPGHVSTVNSREHDPETPLLADEVFTGEWEDITNFGVMVVSVFVDVASATDGLMVEFSTDGTGDGLVSDDVYTIAAGAKKTFSFQAASKFYRVVYTNGGDDQTHFHLQTVLKPYYVKPSSHRIQDSIIDDDDAELVKSVLTGESEVSGVFENVKTRDGALNVNSAFVYRKIVNETFHQHVGTPTTPSVAISMGDTSMTLTSVVGLSVGNKLKLEEGVNQEIGVLTITDITANVVTIDRPLGNDYTTSASVSEVITNMIVDGTLASPEIFEIDPPPGTVWQITRLLISITHTTAGDNSKFGNIAALENGVCLRITSSAGRTAVFANWKTNKDIKLDMFNVEYTDKAGPGLFGTDGRWTFTTAEVVLELDGDADPTQSVQILIQDQLDTIAGLVTFEISAQGRVFSPQ